MKPNSRLRAALAALLFFLPLSVFAGDWSHKQKIGLDNTAEGADLAENAAQVPLAIRLHSGNFTFADAKPDGSDIRFLAADGKTPLKFHLEQFDPANELGVVWVQVPKLTAKAKSDAIFMEYGNPDAPPSADSKGTYDPAQIFVFHFSDKSGVNDATGNGNNARESSAKPVFAGPIGTSVEFDGSGRVLLPASPSLSISAASGFTFSAWLKPAGADAAKIFTLGSGPSALTIELVSGTPVVTQRAAQAKTTATPLKAGVWQHLAVTVSGGKLTFYVDGKEAGGGVFALTDVAGDAVLGAGYKGEMDEVGLAGVARSADFIKALASSQAPESPMVNFDDGGGSGESVSYFAILLGAVTLDGWVVIGILMVMAVISFAVMIGKTKYLGRAEKGNDLFLERFKKDPDALLHPDTSDAHGLEQEAVLAHSSLYRLYRIGLHEVSHRFESQRQRGEAPNLSAAALNSIRAAIDAGMVKENHRLNSQIVLLTIAISGGPFLGLLGTVVGVMITFAAIAAAGDVNVNAIAPGIAAALVATVAGLAVAIPALFGYNWLASKIKNISADMLVFADEFVTKSAELHSR